MPVSRGFPLLIGAVLCCAAGPAQAAPEGKGILDQLGESAAYALEGTAGYFPQTYHSTPLREVSDWRGAFWTRLSAKSQVFLRDSLQARIAAYASYSTQHYERHGVFVSPETEKPHGHYAELKELSIRWDLKRFALLAGRAPIPVGLATLYSPTDRYRTVDAANPMSPVDRGALQVTADLFLGENTLRLSVLPFEERSAAPYGRSRWLGGDDTSGFISSQAVTTGLSGGMAGLTVPPGGMARTVFRNRPGFLAKYSGVATGADYFLALHYGPSVYPVLRNVSGASFEVRVPTALSGSLGISRTSGALEMHSEAVYQQTRRGEDQDFLRYVVGGIYRDSRLGGCLHLQEIVTTVEYAGDCAVDGQDARGYVRDSFHARPFTSTLLFKIDFIPGDKVTASIGGIRNFIGDDYTHVFGVEYKPNDNLTWRAAVILFGGRAGTPFGRWDRNDHVELGVTRRF